MAKGESYPLNVVGPDSRPYRLEVEVFDVEAWERTPDTKKHEMYDTAMMYGTIEYHKRWPIATVRRCGQARL